MSESKFIILTGIDPVDEPAPTKPAKGIIGSDPSVLLDSEALRPTLPQRDPSLPPLRPLRMDTSRVRAIPSDMQAFHCFSCDKLQAKWAFLPSDRGPNPDPIPVCSLCWLYKQPWGRNRALEIKEYCKMLEGHSNPKLSFVKDGDENLVLPQDADRVMHSIYQGSVLADRLDKLKAKAGVQ